MSGNFLRALFSVAPLPPEIVPEVVTTYQHTYIAQMAKNSSLQGLNPRLLRGLEVEDLVAAIESHSPTALEFVLAGHESRDAVVQAVLRNWDLSTPDLVRLASRRLAKGSAYELALGPYPKEVRATAILQVAPAARLEWIVKNEPDDQLMLAHLIELAPQIRSTPLLVSALLLRRPLRGLALTSAVPRLQVAACWTELKGADQTRAVEFALGSDARDTTFDPVIGLLNQPGLSLRHRKRLDAHLRERDELAKLAGTKSISTLGLGRRKATPQFAPTLIAKVQDYDQLYALLHSAGRSTRGNIVGRERAVTTPLLYELSLNKHLQEDGLRHLARVLSLHADLRRGVRNPALGVATTRVAKRLGKITQETPRAVLRRFSMDEETLLGLRIPSPAPTPTTSTPRSVRWCAGQDYTLGQGYAENLLATSVREVSRPSDRSIAQMHDLGAALAQRLGDGATEESSRSWLLFLGLVENDPDVPVETVVATAKTLARVEQ